MVGVVGITEQADGLLACACGIGALHKAGQEETPSLVGLQLLAVAPACRQRPACVAQLLGCLRLGCMQALAAGVTLLFLAGVHAGTCRWGQPAVSLPLCHLALQVTGSAHDQQQAEENCRQRLAAQEASRRRNWGTPGLLG